MSFLAKEPEKKKAELIEAGMHPAYLQRMVYLGNQESEYQGKKTQRQRIRIDFEFPDMIGEYTEKETQEKKKYARSLGMEFTLSLSEKSNLLPFIQGWIGRGLTIEEREGGFDVSSLLGKQALVTVVHEKSKKDNEEYSSIASVSPPMKNMPFPQPFSDAVSIDKADWGGEEYDKLPEWIKDKIKKSIDWKLMQKRNIEELPTTNLDEESEVVVDGVPF